MNSVAPEPEATGNKTPDVPVVPDLSCISPGDSAMAACLYIDAGFYLLPMVVGSKSPGSLVGKDWPKQSSRDPMTVADWWTRLWREHGAVSGFDVGIAGHTGKSGLTFFDLDTDRLPDELAFLITGVVQYSRRTEIGSDRGHYGFFTGTEIFTSGDLKLADGTVVGEIRSGNTVIALSPTPHINAEGQYHWRASDLGSEFPLLPDEARKYLTVLGTTKASVSGGNGSWGAIEASDETVTAALADSTANERPKALDGLVNMVRKAKSATRNRARDALRIAAGEARIGFYPFIVAVEQIENAARDSYLNRHESFELHMRDEFSRLVANGVGYAFSRSLDDIRAEANGDYGTGRRNGNASGFIPRPLEPRRPLRPKTLRRLPA